MISKFDFVHKTSWFSRMNINRGNKYHKKIKADILLVVHVGEAGSVKLLLELWVVLG